MAAEAHPPGSGSDAGGRLNDDTNDFRRHR